MWDKVENFTLNPYILEHYSNNLKKSLLPNKIHHVLPVIPISFTEQKLTILTVSTVLRIFFSNVTNFFYLLHLQFLEQSTCF